MHIVHKARRPPRAFSSTAAVMASRAPLMPSGCPSAMAPPLGLTCSASSGSPSCRSTASDWAAKASFSSTTSRSLMPIPALPSSLRVAGTGPMPMIRGGTPATRKLLGRAGIGISDLDVVELNEAFAAQSLAVLRQLGLPDDAEHVNPNGGAIALGHPLGMSGARLALTAAVELKARGGRRALCTMCIGVGQGIALLLEAP